MSKHVTNGERAAAWSNAAGRGAGLPEYTKRAVISGKANETRAGQVTFGDVAYRQGGQGLIHANRGRVSGLLVCATCHPPSSRSLVRSRYELNSDPEDGYDP